MARIFIVEVTSTNNPLPLCFPTSPGLSPEARFSYRGDPVTTVAGKKYSFTKPGKAQAARARKRFMCDAISRAKKRKTGRSMNCPAKKQA